MRHDLCKFSHSSKHLREAVFQSRWQAAKKSRLARALNWYVCRICAKEFLAMAVDIIALVIPSDYPGAPSRQQPSHFSHKRTTPERVARQGHGRMSDRCLLYPRKRTWISPVAMSSLCQKQTLQPVVALALVHDERDDFAWI